ncbi:MAG: hypothetical protein WBF83_06045 [Moheibacter sp.]
MTVITVNRKSKAGKILLDLAKMLSEKNSADIIITNDDNSEIDQFNQVTKKAIKDAKSGKTSKTSLAEFRKQLYS